MPGRSRFTAASIRRLRACIWETLLRSSPSGASNNTVTARSHSSAARPASSGSEGIGGAVAQPGRDGSGMG